MIATVLVLAGQRRGGTDALAQAHGLSHKAMIRVDGQALIGRVLETMVAALPDASIIVSIESWTAMMAEPTVARLLKEGRLKHAASRDTIFRSLTLAASSRNFPLLVTTADNAPLTVDAVRSIARAGVRNDSAIVALARKEAIELVHPGGKGRYFEFRDGSFSNCNLFWIGNRSLLGAASTFKEGGQFLKVKGRLLKTFGLVKLVFYRLGILTLAQMFDRLSRRLGCRVVPLVLDDGRLAINVDDERSLLMVYEILEADRSDTALRSLPQSDRGADPADIESACAA